MDRFGRLYQDAVDGPVACIFQRPFGSCRAACVTHSPTTNRATFSYPFSCVELAHGEYPSVPKAWAKASSVSASGTPRGQNVIVEGHHHRPFCPAAQAMQL